jgi:glycosyltransferase involved in cell wall biosynthesis
MRHLSTNDVGTIQLQSRGSKEKMKKVRPLLILRFNSAALSGGNRRTYEILKLAKSQGVEYIILTDSKSCLNAAKMFPSYLKTLSMYKVYIDDHAKRLLPRIPGLRQIVAYKNFIDSVLFASRVASKESADIIIGFEETESLLISCLAGRKCKKPWTAIYQPTTDILQPSPSIGPLNVTNILKFIGQKASMKNLSFISRVAVASELLFQLKVAEMSLILSVSSSVKEDFSIIDPKIEFCVINPGNGINPEKYAFEKNTDQEYDAIFFARLIPEKGLYDLPVIWKSVTEKMPGAKLAVAGITEDEKYVFDFQQMIAEYGISKNITFLGKLSENDLISSIKSSKLSLYPSVLDSFSLVTLESLACGIPVVAYDIPAIRHNFGKCDAVFRCPIKDFKEMTEKVLRLLKEDAFRTSLGKKAIEYSRKYIWPNVMEAEKQAYYRVIERFLRVESTTQQHG